MKREKILFAAGFAAVALLTLPCILLGEQAVFTYHDQLDGEMIAYILQAKHLGDGDLLPEFLGGASKTALMPPSPGSVLLFRVLSPLHALIFMQLAGSLTGYVGMYLLCRKVTDNRLAALIAGCLYAALPFLPVYGLSQFGLPMLLWCVLRVREEPGRRTLAGAACYSLIYAFHSSLALVGFGVLGVLALWIFRELWGLGRMPSQRAAARRAGLRMGALWLCLCLPYLWCGRDLIAQLLGAGGAGVSHKAEYAVVSSGLWTGWRSALLYGGQHSEDYHLGFALLAVVTACVCIFRERKASSGTALWGGMAASLAGIVLLSGLSAVWNLPVWAALRERMGALGAFQMDRLLWLNPCLWYLLLGCAMAYLMRLLREEKRAARILGIWGCALAVVSLGVTGFGIAKNSDVKANVRKLWDDEYPAMSYGDYYAVGVMEQVRDFLTEYTGEGQEAYRVVSLGIDPAAALYHGFYCLDGYSNNYSLEYKHRFRRVIAPALEESEYLRAYYDDWGNRCYLFGSESPGYYTIQKNGFYFEHLECDTEALKELGGDYLLSAAYIANSDALGLTLLREEPFETGESYYRIFLYEISGF